MAEEQQQERTEQPTPKRLEDARKKGDVPRSRELTMTGVMLAGASALLLLGGVQGASIVQGFRAGLVIERDLIFDPFAMPRAFSEAALHSLVSLLPFGVILLLAVFGSATLLGGWSFSGKAVAPKFERLSPLKGFKRMFGANALNELAKAIGKFLMVALIAIGWLWWSTEDLLTLSRLPVNGGIRTAIETCAVSLLVVSCGLIVIAAIDVPFQLWNYRKKLRMTRQEIKDEFKETDGRPEVKARVRQLQQQAAQRRMMADVPEADVVITNPTHYAVALKYDRNGSGAPRVVAKGKDLVAAKIREIATAHNVPLFSAPPLARALHSSTKLGQEIPAALFTAVAQVLAYIFQIRDAALPRHLWPEKPDPQIDESEFGSAPPTE